MTKLTKSMSLFIVLFVYAAAFTGGLLVYQMLPFHPVWKYLMADAAATIIVWLFGLIYKNASMYDPYWSVAPLLLFICFILEAQMLDAADILYIAVFAFWGVRLTVNWILGWDHIKQQDWRYSMLKEQNKALWPVTNFFGINMMPTLIVFANLLPAYFCTLSADSLTFVTALGALVCVGAAALQIVSDGQMRRFKSDPQNRGVNMEQGLWKYSRHPNYMGEVSFWWGVWIMQIGQIPGLWWTIFAPVFMTLLFVFISIPMMERRLLETKEGYSAYRQNTSMLLLLPLKKRESH